MVKEIKPSPLEMQIWVAIIPYKESKMNQDLLDCLKFWFFTLLKRASNFKGITITVAQPAFVGNTSPTSTLRVFLDIRLWNHNTALCIQRLIPRSVNLGEEEEEKGKEGLAMGRCWGKEKIEVLYEEHHCAC